jgi:aminoglycoside phosphotransferase (APT) family kinase protein
MSLRLESGLAAVQDYLARSIGTRPHLIPRLLDTPNGERLVAEFSFAGGDPLIAKCYADDTGRQTRRNMTLVTRALEKIPDPVLAVPKTLCYDSARRCLVQQRVDGTPYFFLAGTPQFFSALRRAGEALSELHRLELPSERAKSLEEHLSDLVHPHPLVLAEKLPELRQRIYAVLSALKSAARRSAGEILACPVHRDFHLRQLFLEGDRVWLIDWDLFAFGDPALDVGNFLMYLETRLDPGQPAAAEAFLEGYFRRGDPAVRSRIGLYMGLNYLRRAAKHCRLGAPGWPSGSAEMVTRAEACVADWGEEQA